MILSNNDNVLKFYHNDLEVLNQWIKHIRVAIDYRNFFEHYKLVATIAEGQYGKVTLAQSLKTDEKVATKILTKNLIKDFKAWELFKNEIDILRLCKHKNIVKFIDNFENSEYIFIVMEYLPSGTLHNYLRSRNFEVHENIIKRITYQITEALLYLHKFGIIHRDLKPDNILIADSNVAESEIEVKINDFGFSKVLGENEKTNEGYGSYAFLAPEIIIRLPYNNTIDIWSLGITIYFMVAGELPFQGLSKDELFKNICLKDLIFAPKFKIYSMDMLSLIYHCLAKDSEKRIKLEVIKNHSWFRNFRDYEQLN